MKKLILALLLALPLTLAAQQKIAVVNSSEIMAALPDTKSAEAKLKDLATKYEADLKSMQDEYKNKVEAFTKEKDKLPEAIQTRRLQEMQDIEGRIQQSYQAMQEDMQKQQQALLAPIQSKVQQAIKRVGDANGIAYIFEEGLLLHQGKDAINLTLKVLADLGVKAPATPAKK